MRCRIALALALALTLIPSAYAADKKKPAAAPAAHPAATSHPAGNAAHPAGNAGFHSPAPRGAAEHTAANGSMMRTRADGHVSDLHDARRGMDVHHDLGGGRRVSVMRADRSRVVFDRGRRGFIERPYGFRGQSFARRSYYFHGHAYDRFYRDHYYRGVYMHVYAPRGYYRPMFYGWAYRPWARPVRYDWAWRHEAWYGRYGYYFAPELSYGSPALWLSDYVLSSDLAAYDAASAQGMTAPAAGAPLITPGIKQQLATEIQGQIALENQEASLTDVDPNSSGVARLLTDGQPHVFVAGAPLDVATAATGQECALSEGDMLALPPVPQSPSAPEVQLTVLAAKGGIECPAQSTVTVQVADLQEMQNHLRESVDQGLAELAAGQNGLPAVPAAAQGQPTDAAFVAGAPPAEPDGQTSIDQQGAAADQAEQEAGH